MRRWITSCICVLLAGCSGPDEEIAMAWSNAFVVQGASVFDGERLVGVQDVVVRDGRIHSVGSSEDVPEWVPRTDGSGGTLIPGLIDGHTHHYSVEDLRRSLRFGVTTVIDMLTFPEDEAVLRTAASERNDVAGFYTNGIVATAPGGHGTEYGIEIPTVAAPEDAEAFVEARIANGADFLKIALNGQRAMMGMPTLDLPTAKALVDAGKKRGLLVVAHIETLDDVKLAVEAGVDGLVHVWRVPGAPDEIVALLQEHDVWVMPTLSVSGAPPDLKHAALEETSVTDFLEDELEAEYRPVALEELPPEVRAQVEGFLQAMGLEGLEDIVAYHLESVRALIEGGVELLVGSDAPAQAVVHGIGTVQELEFLVEAGMTPTEALSAGTSGNADAFGLTDRGRIAPGKRADLVLVPGDPTTDITVLRRLRSVWRGGVEFERDLTER